MELIWDGLATIGLTTLLLLAWAWWQGDDEPPATPPRRRAPSGPAGPPPALGAVAHEAVIHQVAATQWEQDEALLAAARQMLGVMQAYQADGDAVAEDGATTSRRKAGNGTGGSIDDLVDAGD